MEFKNLCELLEVRSKNKHTQITFYNLSGAHHEISYNQIFENAKKVAAGLQQKKVHPGSVVAILLPTSADFLFAFFGVQLAGCIPVSLYPPLKLGKLDEWIQNSIQQLLSVNAQAILTDKLIINLLGEVVDATKMSVGALKVSDLIEIKSTSDYTSAPVHPLAFLQFSSGTTGFSKPVSISHSSVLDNADAIIHSFHIQPFEGRCVSWLPLYHDMGLVGGLISCVLADCQLMLLRPENFIGIPFIWLKAISDFKANVTVAPNFAYGLCARRIQDKEKAQLDLSCLQIALCGAEMIHPQTMNEFVEAFKSCGLLNTALTPVYGMAEVALAATFSPSNEVIQWIDFDRNTLKPGAKAKPHKGGTPLASVGRPLRQTHIEIRDDQDKKVSDTEIGVIWIKSPSLMSGYYQQEKKTSEVVQDGWFNTGDYGFLYNGNLFITGRKKEILILRGQNYDPSLIERSLLQVSEIREGCAVAFSSNKESSMTEELYIVAETKKGVEHTPEMRAVIEKKIAQIIAEHHQLSLKKIELYSVGVLPRTSSGKIKRVATKELWETNQLGKNPSRWVKSKVIKSMLKSHWSFIKRRLKITRASFFQSE